MLTISRLFFFFFFFFLLPPAPLEEHTHRVGMCEGLRASVEPSVGRELSIAHQLRVPAVGAMVVKLADHPLQVVSSAHTNSPLKATFLSGQGG